MNNQELLIYYEKQIRAIALEKTALRRGIYEEIINHTATPAADCSLPDTETMEMYAEMLRSVESKLEYNQEKYAETRKALKMSTEIYEGDGYNG